MLSHVCRKDSKVELLGNFDDVIRMMVDQNFLNTIDNMDNMDNKDDHDDFQRPWRQRYCRRRGKEGKRKKVQVQRATLTDQLRIPTKETERNNYKPKSKPKNDKEFKLIESHDD